MGPCAAIHRSGETPLDLRAATALLSALLCLGPAACAGPARSQRGVEELADEFLAAFLERFPETGTWYLLPGARHDQLTDNTLAAAAAWQEREDAWLAELDALGPPAEVGSRDWVTYGVLREALAGSVSYRVCRVELWSASSATGWHSSVPVLFEIQPVETPEERQQALDRLSRLAGFVDVEVENLRQGLAAGYSAPRRNVPAVIQESRGLVAEGSPLLSPAVRAGDPEFTARMREVFEREVVPAVERYARFLEESYLPRAREELAVRANPGGDACYPAAVRHFATVDPGAERIHALGLEQLAAIRAEMQQIVDEHFPGETLESLMVRLSADPRFTFRSREAVAEYAQGALARARARMPEAFGSLPRADVEIRPYPAYREGSGTGEYISSSEDGSRPGIYYIAVRDPEQRSIAGQESVLFHETYPGHHLQGAIALELGDRVHPLARYLGNSGFGEGWALYSERLADELGLYSGPLDRLGMLSDQAARAARLVVDSGIHVQGWPRERAVATLRSNTAWEPGDIEAEVDRYIAWPGQATAYMLGMLEIRRLRERAEAELGADFDLRAFHDRVLRTGGITLPMLDASIGAWIRERQSGPSPPVGPEATGAPGDRCREKKAPSRT
jgi:uncharacterized protein (DUF885 family)